MKKKINVKECLHDFFRCTNVILNATFNIVDVVTNEKNGTPTDENLRIAGVFYGELADFVCYMEIYRDNLKKFCEKYHEDLRRLYFESLDSMNTD